MQGFKHYIDFLWAMTEKEIKARYKRAVFGFLWVVLNPVLQMIIIGLIFSFFIKIPNYFLFLLVGLLPWQFFSISLSKATPSIVYERSLLQKAKFPIETIPISLILANFFNMTVSLVILFFLLGFLNKLMFPQILLVVPALIWLLAFTIGLSLLTASLQVRFRDINFFVQTLLILWFYATPVLYTLSLIPKTLYPLFAINPLTSIFEIMHLSLLGQGVVNNQIVFLNLSTSVLVTFVGIFIYKRKYKFFVDWL
jgi:ABC-2 type transport system permease protein